VNWVAAGTGVAPGMGADAVVVAPSPGLGTECLAGAEPVAVHEASTPARAVADANRAARAHHGDAGMTALAAVVDGVNGSGQSEAPGLLTHLISLGFSL
jgi:hypothetical protein